LNCDLENTPIALNMKNIRSKDEEVNDFTSQFIAKEHFDSQPLKGIWVGVISETIRDGVDKEVGISSRAAASAAIKDVEMEDTFPMACNFEVGNSYKLRQKHQELGKPELDKLEELGKSELDLPERDNFGIRGHHRVVDGVGAGDWFFLSKSNALTMSLSSATSDEMAGVDELVPSLATTALACD
nr:glutamyl-tRNA(Gln) amidotransferase subunit A, chloroplastic/mitochondrial [Tanacetum cinerariifolium]